MSPMRASILESEQLEVLQTACPAVFYKPNLGAEENWIVEHGGMPGTRSKGDRPWFESLKSLRISIGGNRAGKTTKLVLETGAFCVGFRPWYPLDHEWSRKGLKGYMPGDRPDKKRRVARCRYIVPNFSVHLPEVVKEFEKWWPRDWGESTLKGQHGEPRQFTFYNGAKIDFMSHHMDVRDFEGIESDWNAWDEPAPPKLWTALERGMVSSGGRTGVGATLLDASGWFWDEVVVHGDMEGADVLVTWHSMWDNTAENGGCPDQTVKNVLSYLQFKVSDPDERLAREHGHPMHVGGLVLSSCKEKHIITPLKPKDMPKDCIIVSAIDPAGTRPFAGLHIMYFEDENGEWQGHLFDETWIVQSGRDLGLFCQVWEDKENGEMDPKHPRRSMLTIIDPFSEEIQKADKFGRSMRRILSEDYHIDTVKADRRGKRARLLSLNTAFKDGHYKVWRSLKRFTMERRRWTWAPDKAKLTKGADDICDCLSYIHSAEPWRWLKGFEGESEGGVWVPPEYREREKRQKKVSERWERRRVRQEQEAEVY